MSSRLRNCVVAGLAVVLGSSALSHRDWLIFLDYGGPSFAGQATQEMMLVSAVPARDWQEEGLSSDQELKWALEALGIQVD
jgi:hypothetical protein